MKRIVLNLMLVLIGSGLMAQTEGVSINPTGNDPDPSAILDISSNQKGLLIPRMNSTERAAISSPAQGLMVFDTTTESVWYYNTSTGAWIEIGGSGLSDFEITGDLSLGMPAGVPQLDASQEAISASAGPLSPAGLWQSFTAENTGLLTQIDVLFVGGSNITEVNIYEGEGTSGTLRFTASPGSFLTSWTTLFTGATIPVIMGTQYTIELIGSGPWSSSNGNPYAGGRASSNPNNDYAFRTFVALGGMTSVIMFDENDNSLSLVNNNLKVLANGNVGIGTTSPQSPLHVVGNFTYQDGNQQPGYVLTSDATGIASWQPPTSNTDQQILNLNGTQLSISNGNTVDLSTLPDDQTLALNGTQLSISNGNAVDLSSLPQGSAGGTLQGTDGNTYNLRAALSTGATPDPEGEYSVDLQTFRNGATSVASGQLSTIGGGRNNTASGANTTIGGGFANQASGRYATIPGGQGLLANSFAETTIGSYNEASGGTATTWTPTDPILSVGNGQSSATRSTAMTVLKNSNVGIGETAPVQRLHIDDDDTNLQTIRVEDLAVTAAGTNEGELPTTTTTDNKAVYVDANGDFQSRYVYGDNVQYAVGQTNIAINTNTFTDVPDLSITFTPRHPVVFVTFSMSGAASIPTIEHMILSARLVKDGTPLGGTGALTTDATDFTSLSAYNLQMVSYPVSVTPGVSTTIKVQWARGGRVLNEVRNWAATESGYTHRNIFIMD